MAMGSKAGSSARSKRAKADDGANVEGVDVQTNGQAAQADTNTVIDTSKMNAEQAAALEVAESARDQKQDPSTGFAGQLLLGRARLGELLPFPKQSDEDRAIGDEMVAQVSAFLREHLDPEQVDATRTIPKKVVKGLKTLGVFRMKVPTEYGGLGFSQVNYNRVLMAIASYCGSTAVLVSAHQSIGLPRPLVMCGNEEQKAKFLPRLAKGEISAFALTEPEAGSDPARMTTKAELSEDGRHYILNGVKQWTTNGPIADLLVVMAQTAPIIKRGREKAQITAFIVEGDTPGIETTHRCDFMGLRGIQNGILTFRNVKVPVENVIWGEGLGLKMALKTLNTGRLTLPAACTGMAKECLRICRQWGNDRKQWGYKVGEHEAGRDKIAFVASTTFAMEAVTWLTSHWADEGRDIRIEAAMAKLFCSEAALQVVDTTLQFRGGRGYERAGSLRERGEVAYPIERMLRDARINTIIEGTSDIMRLFLAREALDPHLRRASDVLRPGVPLKTKMLAGGKAAAHYAWWYPVKALAARRPRVPQSGLGRHEAFIDAAAQRLASSLFEAMAKNGPKLEKRQVLLGHLMEIGTELFVMSAVVAYAAKHEGEGHQKLADVFCRAARRRIGEHFRSLKRTSAVRRANALARGVLKGDFEWLETGAIPCVDLRPTDDAAESENGTK